ncbi:MAG: nitrogen fixation protein NifS, partial [Pseudomonadales bacterium]|nr:nitrogen fixation protein NifS [Pseudomonadales bacterium]
QEDSIEDLTHILCDQRMLVSAGHFYAPRLLEAMGIDSETGVIRLSMAHYNDHADVQQLIDKLGPLF